MCLLNFTCAWAHVPMCPHFLEVCTPAHIVCTPAHIACKVKIKLTQPQGELELGLSLAKMGKMGRFNQSYTIKYLISKLTFKSDKTTGFDLPFI